VLRPDTWTLYMAVPMVLLNCQQSLSPGYKSTSQLL